MRAHYGSANILSDLHRLRADLLDLIPERLRTINELVEAQEDRLLYAMRSPDLQKLSDVDKRFAAQALARPALVLSAGKLLETPQNWASLLVRREPEIVRIAQSTGLLMSKSKESMAKDEPSGTAFVVAPNLAVTTRHVIDYLRERTDGSICFGDSMGDCKQSLSIGKVVYRGEVEKENIALFELPNHDPLLVPPLALADPLPTANMLVGRYAYVVGFPFIDQRMPPEFISRVLGNRGGQKRIMPGRILGFSAFGSMGPAAGPQFTSDISTTAGTSGGPLVDLVSGEVLGVSFAGAWKGERGKFAYAQPIPKEIIEIIASRNRGEPIKFKEQPKSAQPIE